MPRSVAPFAADPRHAFPEIFLVNDRMNQLIIENLDPRAWRAEPPGHNVRTIAAIFAHVHNIRRKWLRLSAPHLKLPAPFGRARCTQRQARSALAQSARCCAQMLAESFSGPESRVLQFRRDAWARPWPAGPAMLAYMLTHEAHHRGQVCLLAHQLGFPLRVKTAYGMWVWEKLRKDCGFSLPR